MDPATEVIREGALEAEFDPAHGGRLSALRFDGVDVVLPKGRVVGVYGSTFWPSPQERFDWPPPPVLDEGPYELVDRERHALVMRSQADTDFGFRLQKRYAVTGDSVAAHYTLTNIWPAPQFVAPWQVTRAPLAGLAVWSSGELFADEDRVHKQRVDPGCWYMHVASVDAYEGLRSDGGFSSIDLAAVTRVSKLFADAHGWLAHVHSGTLLLKTFPDLSIDQIAPRQGEVEVYVNPRLQYIELENQGEYTLLEPGQSLDYTTLWKISRIAPELPVDRVTGPLAEAIARLLGKTTRGA